MVSEAVSVDAVLGDEQALSQLTPEQLDALIAKDLGFEDKSAPPAEPPPPAAELAAPKESAPPAPQEPAKGEGEKEQGQQDEPPADGVRTKDGKHIVPYDVLKSAREHAAGLEAQVRELTQQLDQARNAQASTTASEGLSEVVHKLEAIGAELDPNEFASIHEAVGAAKDKLQQFAQWESRVREDEQARQTEQVRLAVQADIDAVPKLAYLQSSKPRAWEAAVAIDQDLMRDAGWNAKPRGERFAEVLRLYEQEFGEVTLPSAASDSPAAPVPAQPAVPGQAATEAARARVAAASAAAPATLSDIPGGQFMAVDEIAQIDHSSTADIHSLMQKMTPEQLEAYLAKLG